MRGLTRRWIVREPIAAGASPPVLGVGPGVAFDRPPVLERIMAARGLVEAEDVRRFCDPRLTDLHDPALLPGVDAAAARLVAAVRHGTLIAIYGDYDVDGITATAILYHLIKAAAPDARIITYVPHRLDEGYGLNEDAIRQLGERGVEVIVSVDCGITATGPAAVAREAGIDLIITDHHTLPAPEALPDALLVHPELPGSQQPFAALCGAGVAFKLAWRFATCWCGSERVSQKLQKTLLDLLPLVALGTIADVVPLVDENRVLASYGLRLIKRTTLPGLRALIEASGLMGENIDSEKVGFVLGPRLNACGRMGHAEDAVRMLTDASPAEAAEIAKRLSQINRQRREIERTIADHAMERAEASGMTADDRRVIVLADPSWHPGVVGIVCSRLVERFGRPTVLLQQTEDQCRGSARSIDGYSIHDGLAACAEHLDSFGGHAAAAGLALDPANLEAFTAALTEHANARIAVEDLTPSITIDTEAMLRELDLGVVRRLMTLSPFGRRNPRPTLRVRNVVVAETPKVMGAKSRHLSLRIREDHDGRRCTMRVVWWGAGERVDELAAGMPLDVVLVPRINEWNGRTTVEGEIRDVRIAETGEPATSDLQHVEV